MSHPQKGKSTPRDPPPTLFNHPSASHASLPGLGAGAPQTFTGSPGTTQAGPSRLPPTSSGLNIPIPGIPSIPSLRSRESTRATDRTDALWAEMQATLEAVELSAGGGNGSTAGGSAGSDNTTSRVFGPDHERKLDELRAAQIALAQAWARSEADEAIETTQAATGAGAGGGASVGAGEGGGVGIGGVSAEGKSVVTDAAAGVGKSTVGTGSARPGSSGLGMGGGGGGQGKKMEEETEVDILLARKRREANDRYFKRVNQGVLDVVAKLEDVAIAMRAVEQESKDLWGDDNESVAGSAKA